MNIKLAVSFAVAAASALVNAATFHFEQSNMFDVGYEGIAFTVRARVTNLTDIPQIMPISATMTAGGPYSADGPILRSPFSYPSQPTIGAHETWEGPIFTGRAGFHQGAYGYKTMLMSMGYGNDPFVVGIDIQPVPEPGTMMALGLGAIAMVRKRRR